jgi:hypothetical protein
MSDTSHAMVCGIYPLKCGWKILSEGVRVGLASTQESALSKVMRLSANLGVIYRIRIYREDGSLEKETSCFSPTGRALKSETSPAAFSEAVIDKPAAVRDSACIAGSGEDENAGVPIQERIALLAYSYWEDRGCQGGSPEEDWLCAEREVLKQLQARSRTLR